MEGIHQVSILEKDAHTKPGRFPGHGEKVSELSIPIDLNAIKKSQYDELLTKSREEILNDENLLNKILQAITAKTQDRAVIKFAEVENILVEKCINLTENDIDSVIRQLGRKFLDYIRYSNKISEITGQTREDLLTGRFNIDSRGIKSVIGFVRERVKLLMKKPTQRFILGFNNRLDAVRKIDLVEIILGETDAVIEQLNFIQVKNSPPTSEEMSDIVKEHGSFAHRDILSLKDIENSELPGHKISINSVNSIVAIGPRIVNQMEVYNSERDVRGTLAATDI
jgi:hypothetical protein